ncbi:MAG TPA: TIGR03621 family F420-dependent LLM class oxidoreductase [Acidimicrobiales bacterium]|nr:TIGR03621 family F420-dependent LLM class oxidoreductase [Acidimicrobiales bacterium]
MTKPFRFAVQTSTAESGKAWREKARKIEGLGYSTMFIPDHFDDQWAPIVGMTVAAEATDRLNVGALVFDNDYRHPIVLAKEIATLDLASEGRVEFGLGAGWLKSDYDASGIAYDSPGTRIDRMVEGLAVMKQLWRDGSATLDGKHYSIAGANGYPRPASSGGPKIVIGGGGKRVLSIAAREADIIGVNPNLSAGYVGPEVAQSAKGERYRERLQWIKDAAGDRFDDIELQCLTFMVQFTDDSAAAYEQLAPLFGLTPDEARDVPIALAGTFDEIAETLQRRREQYGFSYVVVHEPEMEQFAEVVAKLAGT